MNLYCLYDKIAKFYEPPLAFASDEEAARTLARYALTVKSQLISLLTFDLYLIGSFNPDTGGLDEFVPQQIDNFNFYLKKGLENAEKK